MTDGVWVVWDRDGGPFVISIHATELEALRDAVERGYGKVTHVPFGFTIADTLRTDH